MPYLDSSLKRYTVSWQWEPKIGRAVTFLWMLKPLITFARHSCLGWVGHLGSMLFFTYFQTINVESLVCEGLIAWFYLGTLSLSVSFQMARDWKTINSVSAWLVWEWVGLRWKGNVWHCSWMVWDCFIQMQWYQLRLPLQWLIMSMIDNVCGLNYSTHEGHPFLTCPLSHAFNTFHNRS